MLVVVLVVLVVRWEAPYALLLMVYTSPLIIFWQFSLVFRQEIKRTSTLISHDDVVHKKSWLLISV